MSIVLAALTGLALGSFANVLIDRLPVGRSLRGRSQCAACRRTLRWWELVPVVSACILRHRCRTCDARIPLRVTLVEIGTAILFAAIVAHAGGIVGIATIVDAVGLWTLGVLAVIDHEHGVVPDIVSLPALATVVVGRGIAQGWVSPERVTAAATAIGTVLLGAGFFWVQRMLSRGRWVGDGDIRIGAIMGALALSPLMLAVSLGSAYVVGGAVAAVLLATGRATRGDHMPLVPFLAIGSAVTLFWGERIVGWYA